MMRTMFAAPASKGVNHARGPATVAGEQGMVSIMVTLILMIVISLTVLGFAQIARRNQRTTLDQQLSTQAFYAAESGVNDAAQLLRSAIAAGNPVYAKPDCGMPSGSAAATFYSQLPAASVDAADSVSYSCLMVNPNPATLTYSDVGTSVSTVVPLSLASGASLGSITLNWQSKAGTSTPLAGCPAGTNNVFTPTWTCGYGVLRFDVVPTSGGSLTAGGLQANDMVGFVVPVQSGGTASIAYAPGTSNANDLIAGNCTNNGCSLTITGLTQTQYYLRVSSIYTDNSLQITSGGAGLSGAQVVIDATGKAQDVLRRIQVHIPLTGMSSTTQLPDYAFASTQSVCKRFATMQNYFQSSAGVAGSAPADPLCQ